MVTRVGKYQTIRPLASGGMATVYLGNAVGMGGFERLVAIKVMHPHIAKEPGYVEMFLDEARLAARIRHPNVVSTIDVEQDETGCPYLVMDFIEGPTLGQMIKCTRKLGAPMPIEVALRILIDTLSGVHAAHELRGKDKEPLNLVHRDVSPQNVIVGNDGSARLTDFGVAKARLRMHSTRSNQLKGKLGYLAPEQLGEQPVDRRADVYSAGVVLWETLTSRRLFKAEHEAALVRKLLEGAKQSPREVSPEVPIEIDRACMRALAQDPASRYATAAHFADALEDAATAAGVQVASTRGVAEYVKTLPIALPSASIPPPSDLGMDYSGPIESWRTVPSGSGLTSAALAATHDEVKSQRSHLPLVGIALALVVVGGGGLLLLRSGGAPVAEPAVAPAAQAAAHGEQAPSAKAEEPPRAADRAAASPSTTTTVDPKAEPDGTASARTAKDAAPTTPRATGPAPRGKRSAAHSDYRPDGL